MDKQEQAFWNYYDLSQAIADKNGLSIYQVVNFRQIFDYAYALGKEHEANSTKEN